MTARARVAASDGNAVAVVARTPEVEVLPARDHARHEGLIAMFLSGRSRRTLEAYRQDLERFRDYLGVAAAAEAAAMLLGRGHGEANALAIEYRAWLREQPTAQDPARTLSAATVNRRLAALRSLVKMARIIGLVSWELEVESLPEDPYRDTRGPTVEQMRSILVTAAARRDQKGRRDYAIVRLLHDLALRREEVVSRDLEHVDLDGGTIEILGKGRTGAQKLTLPEPTGAALAAWIEERGTEPGPLFVNLDRAGKLGKGADRRLTSGGLYRMVRRLAADAAGVRTRPHGFRHYAITRALDLTNGDLRRAQRFSRHRDPRTLLRYDDNRRDLGGEVASLVAAGAAADSL